MKRIFAILVSTSTLFATWFDNVPRILDQPDGHTIHCFISGDQYGRRLHDENNFTILLNQQSGFYHYAENVGGELVPSEYVVGEMDPASVGLMPGLSISPDEYQRNREFYHNEISMREGRDAPTSGEIAQINIFIRFSDDPEFPNPRSYYDAFFQSDEDEPSLRHYFWEVSYNALLVNTFHFPGSIGDLNMAYVDIHPRGYYQPHSAGNPNGYQNDQQRTEREHSLLANAVNAISNEIDPSIDIDANDDGYVDAVSFVIYGQPDDWADLLWPHRWSLYSQSVQINGSQVWDYLFMLSESWYFNVGVLCHEFFHVLGAPDLYHYDGGGAPSPVGGWDVMESNSDPPQYMSAFMKWKYGDWLPDLPEITQGGTYTLYPLQQQENVIFKIASPNLDTEYFVLEYRKQEGMYESNLPGNRSGLLVYRINLAAGNGNASGPPDEIYVYRPGGTLQNNGNFDLAPYNSEYDHTLINDDTNPSCFLYNNGSGGEGGLFVSNVTEANETISFTVIFDEPVIEVSPNELSFVLESGENDLQFFTLSNGGEPQSQLNYQVGVAGALPYDNPQGGPDGGNYYWTTSAAEPGMAYEWIEIEGIAIQLELPHNDQFATNSIELPFEFEYFGETYDYVEVNANGWVGWNSANETVWLNEEIPSSSAPRPAIFGFWDDLNPYNNNANADASGNIYYHMTLDRVVIWYDDVVRWSTTDWGQFDFQIVLNSDGSFRTNYREMSGVLNSATIGFQNSDGTQGTQIAANENFVGNGFSWFAATSSDVVPWIILSSNTGSLSGMLYGGESTDIQVQVSTANLEPGNHEAIVTITSNETAPAFVPITLTVTGENTTPTLPFIDISNSENGIVDLPDDIDPLFLAVASRYTHLVTPNGEVIPFLIQDDFTDTQILHARGVLKSYLTDIPESEWGHNKTSLANALAFSNAIMFLLNDQDEYENPDLWALWDAGINGQDLLAIEVFPEGSNEYMNSVERDATYEEMLHFVHGFGIQLAMPAMQSAIENAMNVAIANDYYFPLDDLPEEDYDEEYFAMGLECYFGLWAHDPNENGFCGDDEYTFITRELMMEGDPGLYSIINGYFGESWEYTSVLPENFYTDFFLSYQADQDYTFRSQYLKNVTLSGGSAANIFGNTFINELNGNEGNNHFQGFEGDDFINGGEGQDRAIYQGNLEEYFIIPPFYTDDSSYQIIDVLQTRDGTDHLYDIEELDFNGVVHLMADLLELNDRATFPTEFALHAAAPNPFNPTTTLKYDVAHSERVTITIYNIKGKRVRILYDDHRNRGQYEISWDGRDMNGLLISTGVYFIQLQSKTFQKTVKVLFLK